MMELDDEGESWQATTEAHKKKKRWRLVSDSDDEDTVLLAQNDVEGSDEDARPKTSAQSDLHEAEQSVSGGSSKHRKSKTNAVQQIRSETQRLVRESRVSLPYHRPRQRSLADFLQRRQTLSLDVTNQDLSQVWKQLERTEKEAEEFFKSESDDSEVETEDASSASTVNASVANNVTVLDANASSASTVNASVANNVTVIDANASSASTVNASVANNVTVLDANASSASTVNASVANNVTVLHANASSASTVNASVANNVTVLDANASSASTVNASVANNVTVLDANASSASTVNASVANNVTVLDANASSASTVNASVANNVTVLDANASSPSTVNASVANNVTVLDANASSPSTVNASVANNVTVLDANASSPSTVNASVANNVTVLDANASSPSTVNASVANNVTVLDANASVGEEDSCDFHLHYTETLDDESSTRVNLAPKGSDESNEFDISLGSFAPRNEEAFRLSCDESNAQLGSSAPRKEGTVGLTYDDSNAMDIRLWSSAPGKFGTVMLTCDDSNVQLGSSSPSKVGSVGLTCDDSNAKLGSSTPRKVGTVGLTCDDSNDQLGSSSPRKVGTVGLTCDDSNDQLGSSSPRKVGTVGLTCDNSNAQLGSSSPRKVGTVGLTCDDNNAQLGSSSPRKVGTVGLTCDNSNAKLGSSTPRKVGTVGLTCDDNNAQLGSSSPRKVGTVGLTCDDSNAQLGSSSPRKVGTVGLTCDDSNAQLGSSSRRTVGLTCDDSNAQLGDSAPTKERDAMTGNTELELHYTDTEWWMNLEPPSPDKNSVLHSLVQTRSSLRGAPHEVIEFDLEPPCLEGVEQLVQRFMKHSLARRTISKDTVDVGVVGVEGGKVFKDVVTVCLESEATPGVKLQQLKQTLQQQMAHRRAEEWGKRQQDDEEQEAGEVEELLDEAEAELTDTESESEEEEEDMPLVEKKRVKNAFLDDEADVSDDVEQSEDEEGSIPEEQLGAKKTERARTFDLFASQPEGDSDLDAIPPYQPPGLATPKLEDHILDLISPVSCMTSLRVTPSTQQSDFATPKKLFSDMEPMNTQDNMDELLELCSGKFTEDIKPTLEQQDEEEEVEVRPRKGLRRLDFSDESEAESDLTVEVKDVEYDSEENEVVKQRPAPTDFFEDEAELSESEWGSADEDERDLDVLEEEEGDAEQLDERHVKEQLDKIHMRRLLDEDRREVRLLQELLLEDGELHSEGSGRERKFRWKNIDKANDSDLPQPDSDEGADDADIEDEEAWRRTRHEREMFLQKHKVQQPGAEEEGRLLHLGQAALKRISSQEPVRLLVKVQLTKIAELTHSSAGAPAMGPKNSRNFVFATLSPEKVLEVEAISVQVKKRKQDSVQSVVKRLRLSDDHSRGSKLLDLLSLP